MRVYIENPNEEYRQMWMLYGHQVVGSWVDADIIQFTGGIDVSTRLYGERPIGGIITDASRDFDCIRIFNHALIDFKPMVGICRGAQFLNVMCGGRLWQDVDNHGRTHDALDLTTGRTLPVTSTHHQMMRPHPDGETLMIARGVANRRVNAQGTHVGVSDDVEAVIYRNHNVLCYQPHPEMQIDNPACMDTYFTYINMLELRGEEHRID